MQKILIRKSDVALLLSSLFLRSCCPKGSVSASLGRSLATAHFGSEMVTTRSRSGKRLAAALLFPEHGTGIDIRRAIARTETPPRLQRRKLSFTTQHDKGKTTPKTQLFGSKCIATEGTATPQPKDNGDKDASAGNNSKTRLMIPSTSLDESIHAHTPPPLLCLDDDIVSAKFIVRPSKRNRSPYVADIWLESEQREALAHVPSMDMGGKCVLDAQLYVRPAKDKKGKLVGKDAVSLKYGTPKCEFIAQLLHVDESALSAQYTPTWVGAHPNLGEKIAEQLVHNNLLGPTFPKVGEFQREVRNIAGTDMRADFLIHHEDPKCRPRILEVKTVVDTDYAANAAPDPDRKKCVYTRDSVPYKRAAIFPWGNSNQKGPDGEKVVSARAIKHVRELTKVVQGEHKGPNGEEYDATVLFIVIRGDADYFRPNHEACPSFCKYLHAAQDAGVQILVKQVRWGSDQDIGKCFEGSLLDIEWPDDFKQE